MSLTIEQHIPLAPYTTLGIGGEAEYFVSVASTEALRDAVRFARERVLPITVIGGGSNILVSGNGVKGLVIHMAIVGTTYEDRASDVLVYAGAGMILDTLIEEVVSRELWGLENLSGIPGTVGGVPIQNVGAYGVEAKDVVESVELLDLVTQESTILSNVQCEFAYRDSIFKRDGKGRYIVTGVTFRVSRSPRPQIAYRDLTEYFSNGTEATLTNIRSGVITIRSGKFPDWTKVGTAGSFFKNPFIDAVTAGALRERYPELPMYEAGDGRYKVALGWLLEHVLHLKGYRAGNVGLYEKQALVLVNHGDASFDDVRTFSDDVIQKIFDVTGITIEREVVVLK